MPDPRIIVALDFPTSEKALAFVQTLSPDYCRLKIGFELFIASGPQLIEKLHGLGFELFLDLKLHDIPNTVASACRVAKSLGVWMVNVHASGGLPMLEAAREALEGPGLRPRLIAVTVLTSTSDTVLRSLAIEQPVAERVQHLAMLTQQAELDGVVCSAQETVMLREEFGKGFLLVTPGIRPDGADKDDQQRTTTPRQAIVQGSDYLVIGRPITRAENPALALERIHQECIIH